MIESNADKLAVARECLVHLGGLSDKLRRAPRGSHRLCAEVSISLGNWLLAIAPKLEPTAPPCYKQMSGMPDSVGMLGRQFREVGLALWNQDDTPETPQCPHAIDLSRLAGEIASQLLRADSKKGGAK